MAQGSTISEMLQNLAESKAAIISALTAKGVTVPSGAKFEDIAALVEQIEGGGGSDGTDTCEIDRDTVTSIVIPDGVTKIGSYAFDNCSELTSVVIPESVTSIGTSAFSGCSAITSVTFLARTNEIAIGAFDGVTPATLVASAVPSGMSKENLTSVVIPNGVTEIDKYAFKDCSSLTSVEIPASLTEIGYNAFYGCSALPKDENGFQYESSEKKVLIKAPESLAGEFTIPASVKFIYERAFDGCSSLTSVVIHEGLTEIGYNAFYGCYSLPTDYNGIRYESLDKKVLIKAPDTLAGEFDIPDSVKFINNEAFYGCRPLTSVTIPEGVTTIGDRVFYNCSYLTSVTIPTSVTKIGEYAFRYCSSLASVMIPGNVTKIGMYAFSNCTAMVDIHFAKTMAEISAMTNYPWAISSGAVIHCTDGDLTV